MNAAQVEQLVLKALEASAKEGFPNERIEAELHQLELHARHVCQNRAFAMPLLPCYSSPHDTRLRIRVHDIQTTTRFGVQMSLALAEAWIHGAKPTDLLDLDAVRIGKGSQFSD